VVRPGRLLHIVHSYALLSVARLVVSDPIQASLRGERTGPPRTPMHNYAIDA
jgi:hypothetical protein